MSKLDRPRALAPPPLLSAPPLRTALHQPSPLGQAVGSGDDLVLDAPDEDHRARVLAVDDRISRHDARRHEVALQEEGAVVVVRWCGGGGGGAVLLLVWCGDVVVVLVAVVLVAAVDGGGGGGGGVWTWWCAPAPAT